MKQDKPRPWGAVAVAMTLAGLSGFGLAKLTSKSDAPAVAKAEDARDDSHGALDMAPEKIRAAGVELQTVAAGGLANEVLAQATVTAAPDGEAILTARAPGAVTRINKRIGDTVRAGDTLAVVESREASQIAAERASAAARATLAQNALARERRLYEQRVSPRQDFEQAQAEAAVASAEARRTQAAASAAHVTGDGRGVLITSPISGAISAAPISLGAYVQPETELFRIADPTRVQVEAAVSGADAARISTGDRAIVETPDGRTLNGRVRSITPSLNRATGAATAVLDVPVTNLRPGQMVRARMIAGGTRGGAAVIVPEEAVQSVEGRDVVFVRTAKGFKAQAVTIAQRSAGRAELAAGIAPGAQIATRNAFLLKAELGKGEGDEH
jgi:cobalt-zinc-cadmium efflux system membrane fusion protein